MSRTTFAICAGIRRSASTWLYQVVSEIVTRNWEHGRALGFKTWQEIESLKDLSDGKLYALKTHSRSKAGRELVMRDRAIVFVTYRDPRAIIASLMTMWGKSFDVALREMHSIEREFHAWAPLAAVTRTMFSYERVMYNPRNVISEIAYALGWPVDAGHLEVGEIALKYRVDENLKRMQALKDAGKRRLDDKTLWHNHVTGSDWHEILTDEQRDHMDIHWGKLIEEMGYSTFQNRSAVSKS